MCVGEERVAIGSVGRIAETFADVPTVVGARDAVVDFLPRTFADVVDE